jgi:hypothetical protein
MSDEAMMIRNPPAKSTLPALMPVAAAGSPGEREIAAASDLGPQRDPGSHGPPPRVRRRIPTRLPVPRRSRALRRVAGHAVAFGEQVAARNFRVPRHLPIAHLENGSIHNR